MSHPKRRAMDQKAIDIEGMIAAENDPRQRAFLIVLNSINNSLIANTQTTQDVAGKLDEHLTHYEKHTTDEAALLNKGIGAWRVVAWILGGAQAVVMAGATYLVNDLRDIHASLQGVAISLTDLKVRTAVLEEKRRD